MAHIYYLIFPMNRNENFAVIVFSIFNCINFWISVNSLRISFTKPLYNVGIYQDQDIRKYVTHYDFQMGIKQPNADGEIIYRIRESSEIFNTFEAESLLIGKFYYLRIRTKYSANINRETISMYNLTISGVFESKSDRKTIAEATTQVLVKILDKNDNCPLFTKEKFEFVINENASLGHQVGSVSATDADDGINSEIFYYSDIISLKSEMKKFPFSINPFNGAIYPVQNLFDFVGEKLTWKVSAIHRGDLSLITCDTISHSQISITVLSQNLHFPKITIKTLQKYFDPILEDYPYAEVIVSDEDDDGVNSQRNPYPVYVKKSTPASVHLFLAPTGKLNHYILKLRSLHSFTHEIVTATIEVYDLGINPKSSNIELTIPLSQFRDINLLSIPQTISLTIPENSIVNSSIFLLKTLINSTYQNIVPKLKFAWLQDADGAFMIGDLIVYSTGVISVTRELNAEDYGSRNRKLSLALSMIDTPEEKKMITVQIFIEDINEFPPVVNNNASLVFVKENTALDDPILTVDAYDPDISRTKLTYYLYDQENLPFKLDEHRRNILVVKDNLDAETMIRKYQIRILVTDSGKPLPRKVIAYYDVELMDENEYKPEFLYTHCDIYISRDTPYDFKLGHFIAEDLDRDWRERIRISIASVSIKEPCFNINPQTGALVLLCSLRNRVLFDVDNFQIQLKANDSVFISSLLTLNVTVVESNSKLLNGHTVKQDCKKNNIYLRMQHNLDQMTKRSIQTKSNDNNNHVEMPLTQIGGRKRPTFVISIPKSIHLREELPIGHVVQSMTMEVGEDGRDPYESEFVFGIWEQDNQMVFSIIKNKPNSAQIIIADRLDREIKSKYLLTIAVCDQGKPKYCTFTKMKIQVEDINDNKPRFVDSFQLPIELPENYGIGNRIVQIEATDADSYNTILYRLVNFRSEFRIHKRTGWLRLRSSLDREHRDKYQLIILASDQSMNSKSLTSSIVLNIIVTDVNDNKPIFAKNIYTLSVPEDLPVGSFLVQLHATDLDIGLNGQITFSVYGIHADCFKCDELTGTIHLLCKLSSASEYRLIAVVKDSGKPQSHSSQAELKIFPQRVKLSRYIPNLKDPFVHTFIRENSPAGTLLTSIRPENSEKTAQKFVYTISGKSTGLSVFQINNEGEIRTVSNIDRERHQFFWLFIYIEDRNDDVVHKILAEVYVEVIDENDNYPMPMLAFYKTSVLENLQGIHHLITVLATDNDLTNNTVFKYKIISGDPMGYFSITSKGQIFTTERSIDRESLPSGKSACAFTEFYDLKVMISDSGSPEKINTVNVHINIIDINDNVPIFINNNKFVFNRYLSSEIVQHHLSKNENIFIGRVTAVDFDYDLNSTVRYTLLTPRSADINLANNQSIINLFNIDAKTGRLYVNISSSIFSNWSGSAVWNHMFTVKVWAFDLGVPTLWSTVPASVTVQLYRVTNSTRADNTEKDKSKLYLAYQLSESVSLFYDECIGYEVLPIPVVDPLDPRNSNLELEISDQNGPFNILRSQRTSAVRYNAEAILVIAEPLINFGEKFNLKIIVRNAEMFLEQNLTVLVKFFNKNAPVFQKTIQDPLTISIMDHAIVPSLVYKAQAVVPVSEFFSQTNSIQLSSGSSGSDINEPIIYSISASNDPNTIQKLFYLHSNNGNLNLISPVNRYSNQTFEIIIEARNKRSTYMKLSIHVLDTNNMHPQFLMSREMCDQYKETLRNLLKGQGSLLFDNDRLLIQHHLENSLIISFIWIGVSSSIGTLLTSISAFDQDDGKNGEIIYSIKNDSIGSQYFKIDPYNGEIRTKEILAAVVNRIVFLTVIASDNGNHVLKNQSTVAIEIRDNVYIQHQPQLEKSNLDLIVMENTSVYTILHCLKLRSIQYSTPQFVLISTKPLNAKLFSVTGTTGCIITVSTLDRELFQDVITLEIQVQTYNGFVSKYNSIVSVKIHIADVNDNVPRFVGPLKMHGLISESANPGSLVFIKNENKSTNEPLKALVIQTEDPDEGVNGQIDFIINSNEASYFKIDHHTGVLSLATAIDQEIIGSTIFMSVQLKDKGTPSLRSQEVLEIIITIKDENDSPPKFEKDFYIQNLILPTFANAPLVQLRSTDPDLHSQIHYSIVDGNDGNFFVINAETGWLVINPNNIPVSKQLPRVLLINVLASDGKYQTKCNVTIYSYDDTVTKPLVLERTSLLWYIPENKINVPDLLLPRTKLSYFTHQTPAIKYILLSEHPCLSIDQITGSLKLISPLDREKQPYFNLLVLARGWDGSHAYVNITVNVTDENDFSPLFLSDKYEFLVHFNDSIESQKTKVKAIDLDAGDNGTVVYSIYFMKPYTYDLKFTIDSQTGIITVVDGPTENLLGKKFTIGVKANDKGQPSLSTFTNVMVDVVSDKSPLFESSNYSVSMAEDSVKNKVVITVVASSNTGHTILYTIAKGNEDELFELDFTTGIIRLVGSLDYETKTHHSLIIFATDPSSSLSHSTTIFITVLDCPDEKPIFSKPHYTVSVSESMPINSEIQMITARSQKDNIHRIEFSIKDIDSTDFCSSDHFQINKTTGMVSIRKSLDFEKCIFYEFWIQAKYEGGFYQTTKVPMQITIVDDNDNPPKFIQPSFNVTISFETKPNSIILIAMATDLDSNSKLLYKLLNENYNIFKIDQQTGFIYFNPRPDFRKFLPDTGTIIFQVLVHDSVHSTKTSVTVKFISTKNHAPFFNTKKIHMVVSENATIDSKIGQLTASDIDKDKFGTLQYKIIGGFESQMFNLNAQTGIITIKDKLDRELRSRFELRVAVSDGGSKNDFADVLIHVTDINDNVPVIDQTYYEVTLIMDPEYIQRMPQSILQLHATDKDQSPRHRMDYRLVFPKFNDTRVIVDPVTGQMSLKPSWKIPKLHKSFNITNDSRMDVCRLRVKVCEEPILSNQQVSETESCSTEIPVTINMLYDVQKQNPVITCSIKSVSENNVLHQLVAVCRISPPDTKGKWALVPNNSPDEIHNYFEIDPVYGYIRAKKIMDYEIQSQYRINVEYRVHGSPLMATRFIIIDLTDLNDCHPIFDSSGYSIFISEDIAVGSKVIQCKAVDLDFEGKDKIQYNIFQQNVTDTSLPFRIDEQGWVYTIFPLDYEIVRTINIIVSASDKSGHSTNTSLTISLVDVNDEIPYWVKNPPYDEVEIMETSAECVKDFPKIVYRLDARDNDTDSQKEPITFLFTNQNSRPFYAYFRISETGEIQLLQPLDAEKISEFFELRILASDGLHSTLNEFVLKIKIIDINDHSPICPQVPDLEIYEGIPPGQLVTTVKAYDRDLSPKYNTLTYKLIQCSDPFLLIVEQNTGKIVINAPLDREYSPVVNFIVQASDIDSRTCSFKIKIIVLDVNDNEPKFTHTKIGPLLENAVPGSVVGKIHAVDIDAGLNRKVSYRIVNNSKASFAIDRYTGIVRVAAGLDREVQNEHQIVIEAADFGNPSKVSQTKVNISLLDVNDSPPQFLNTPLRINITEDTPVGRFLITIKAISEDVGINAIISYRIVTEQDQFYLNSTSGDLSLIKWLDYEKNREFFLTVEASDMGYPSLSTSTVMAIQVTDVNDNTPLFPSQPYLFSLLENSPIGKLIGKITAHDSDTDLNSKIVYSFTYWLPEHKWSNRSIFNHVDHFFQLNSETGELFLKFSPDREEQSVYKFQISATDQGTPPLSSNTNVILEIEDMNDNSPTFSKDSYRFLIQVDRSGIIPEGELKKNGDMFEVGRIHISDRDGPTNSRPFSCKLLNAESVSPFSIKTESKTDECILLVTGSLYLGVRNLLVQVNDNGQTTLYSRVRIVIDVIRLSNIPPEIEPLNATYVYYHSSDLIKKECEIAKVLVRDRSPSYDMLKFDLLFNDTKKPQNQYLKHLFKIDAFTGVITSNEQLDSGTYSLHVKVTNGTLSGEQNIFIKIVALTKDMIDSACVIQISNMKPNIFFARRLDLKLIDFLKTAMASKLAYIISIKAGSGKRKSRMKRQLGPDDIIDVLIAIYNENENRFFKSSALVSRIFTLIMDLKNILGTSSVRIFDNVCNDRHICVQGQCQTDIMINKQNLQNNFQVHGVSFSSLDFSYKSSCKCAKYFGGSRCEIPLNKCAHKPCGPSRICRPEPAKSPGFVCECPAFKSGKHCERVVEIDNISSCLDEQCMLTRESEPIHFTGGGFLNWNLKEKSQPLRIDISFGFRLIQKPAPIMEINWNSLRSVLIDITENGKLLIRVDHKTIPPIFIYESRNLVTDHKWHNIRLSIIGVANIPGWWMHIVLDGLLPRSLSLDSWSEGDSLNQSILLGSRNLHISNHISRMRKTKILNESMTGCIRNVILYGQKLPYQQLPTSFSANNIQVQSKNINYGCSEHLLYSVCGKGPCKNGGLCLIRDFDKDPIKSYVCQCQEMYTGKHCEIPNTPCRFSPCLHGGRCVENGDGYKCLCPEGLFGAQCQWGKACSSLLNPCPKFATCLEQQISNQFSNAVCRCPVTFQGYLCQVDVDECQIRPALCQPGRGMCHNYYGGYQCNCSLGYGGRHCETNSLLTIHPDTSSFGLSQYHIYMIVGLLACLFVLALLTVVVLVLRMKPINGLNGRNKKDRNAALSLDHLCQYKVYSSDQCSRYSPASSMMASSIHHPPGYFGGFMVEPPSTPGGRSQMSFHQAPPSHYGHLSQEAIDRVSLCSGSTNDKRDQPGLAPVQLNHTNRYIRSSRGQMYLNPLETRQRASQHSSTFSLVPCNVGPQQHLHLVPNKNSVLFCPAANHTRMIYDPLHVRSSNLSLHSSHAASAQWEPSDNRLDESAISILQSTCSNLNQSHPSHDITPVNGEIDHSMISWNGQFLEDGMYHREMISSQEMSITETTDRSTAHLLPKINPIRINYKMQPPVIQQINMSKPTVLSTQNGHSDSPNTISPSSASIPSGTSSDTKGTAPECEPRDLKKKGNKISHDSNSGEGTECDTEDLEMDNQLICPTLFPSVKHLQEEFEDGLSSVPLLDSIN